MLKRFFITGTDTAVGKTVVSRALLPGVVGQREKRRRLQAGR